MENERLRKRVWLFRFRLSAELKKKGWRVGFGIYRFSGWVCGISSKTMEKNKKNLKISFTISPAFDILFSAPKGVIS